MTTEQKILIDAYIECAMWAEEEQLEDGERLAPETITAMSTEVTDFYDKNIDLIEESGLDLEQVGHDFWLTRKRYGVGFWDRGLGDIGTRLTDAAQACGSVDLYVGDDGLIYQS
jgi:hypothetical protein